MEKVKRTFFTAKNIAYVAVLAALVIVLQACAGFIKIGTTPLSFVLVPIVLGGLLMGVSVGAMLGALFGIVVLATSPLDAFTLYLLNTNPVFTVVLCLLKGVAAGVVPALLYKAISKKNKYVAVIVAAVSAPLVNTGIFVIGAFMIADTIKDCFVSLGQNIDGLSAFYIIFVLCVGINFIVELAINIICTPALYTVNRVVEKQIKAGRKKSRVAVDEYSCEEPITENAAREKENDNLS